MAQAAALTGKTELPPSALTRPLLLCAIALVCLSAAISGAGRWFGHSISMAGHTDDPRPYEIVIGNNVISAPANVIRFDHARRNGIAQRLDMYLRWPGLEGYSQANRDDFNNAGSDKRIIFASLEPRIMSRDMSGRLKPIYQALIEKTGKTGPAGITVFAFTAKSGYANEELAVGERAGQSPFVARCLTEASAGQSLAACQRDVEIGDTLSLSYRFPAELMAYWEKLDAAVVLKARSMIRASKN